MRTINDILPTELLLIIFEQFITSKIIIKWNDEILQKNCKYCKKGLKLINNTGEYNEHNDEHNKIINEERIKEKCMTINKEYNNIRQLKLICKEWKNICHKHLKQILKEGFIRRQMLRDIIRRMAEYAILYPRKEYTIITRISDEDENGEVMIHKLDPWKYNYIGNIALINRDLRKRYYESVIDQECKIINWCTLCNQSVRIVKDERRLKYVKKGKMKGILKRYRHCAHKLTRQEGDNRPVLINTEYIEGIKTKWLCYKKCEIHCLDSFNHCNQNKEFNTYKMDKEKYRQKRITEYPKLIGNIDWNNSIKRTAIQIHNISS